MLENWYYFFQILLIPYFRLSETATYFMSKFYNSYLSRDKSVISVWAYNASEYMLLYRHQYGKSFDIFFQGRGRCICQMIINLTSVWRKKIWTKALVLRTGSVLSDLLCAEDVRYADKLKDRLSCHAINFRIPILECNQKTGIWFKSLPKLGREWYSLEYNNSPLNRN